MQISFESVWEFPSNSIEGKNKSCFHLNHDWKRFFFYLQQNKKELFVPSFFFFFLSAALDVWWLAV